jgi:glycosyltransferase involved in cell wall biosynthesis
MFVAVSTEAHFFRTPDGYVWTQAGFSHAFWARYLIAFDGVRVVARVRDLASPPPRYVRADGPGVSVAAVLDYLGPWQYLIHAGAIRRTIRSAVGPEDAVIMRVGSQLANCMFPMMRRASRPYAVEVVGDPWDVFAPGVVGHPLRPLLRRYFTRQLRKQCRQACAAAYVTERALQQRYPTRQDCFSTAYSSVDLFKRAPNTLSVGVSDVAISDESLLVSRGHCTSATDAFRLVMVGSLAQLYKGPDVALAALAACRRSGLNLSLTIVGDGKFRPKLERLAAQLGLTDRVAFRGQLPQGEAVQAELDRSDLFIMPSRTEGLPRAMVEAMARGLPCIGSCVGGIPELLAPEDMVPPGDARALAAKIREAVASPERMRRMSVRNLKRAMDFREEILKRRRAAFYRFVRERTEEWLQTRRPA